MTKAKSDETINEGDLKDDSSVKDEEQEENNAQKQSKNEPDSANKRKVSMAVPVSHEIKDESSEHNEHIEISRENGHHHGKEEKHETYHDLSHRKSIEKASLPVRKRECRSTSPQRRRSNLADLGLLSGGQQVCNHQTSSHQQLLRIQPAIPANANIRNILENVSRSGKLFKSKFYK